jgi:hypothetical protein
MGSTKVSSSSLPRRLTRFQAYGFGSPATAVSSSPASSTYWQAGLDRLAVRRIRRDPAKAEAALASWEALKARPRRRKAA